MSRIGRQIVAIGILAAAALPARATVVSATLSSRETYVGVPVILRIDVEDGQPEQTPIVPVVNGVSIRLAGGPNRSVQATMINGRVTQQVSVSYDFQITPQQAGRFTIPAVDVQVGTQKLTTQPLVLIVSRSETGDLLFVEVKGARNAVYVGEQVDVTLQIWVRPYQSRELRMTLSEADMWSLFNHNACQWGVFLESMQQFQARRQRPVGGEVYRKDSEGNDRSYYLYEIPLTICPERSGKLDVGDINIVVNYPTGLGRGQTLFDVNRVTVTGVRPVSAQVKRGPVDVKPLPKEGQPACFRGAVGEYRISAAAKPDEVAVGDPITLTLSITGTGRLDQLQPPPLPDLPEVTHGFKVPSDPLAGQIDGKVKRFTQSIRAISDSVKEIPAIPFAYFDPRKEKYVTVQTNPIPLKVRPAEKLSSSQVVDAGAKGPVARTLTEVTSGILANYTSNDDLLGQQDVRPGVGVMALVILPPILFCVCWVVQYHRNRLLKDTAFARRRSARRTARGRIHDRGEKDLPAAVLASVGGYIADRCNLPPGSLTRAEIVELLDDRGVNQTVREEADRLLSTCEQMQYAGSMDRDSRELANAAERCIDLLERERF